MSTDPEEDCEHCLHELPRTHEHAPGQVCCHCGDLFIDRHDERDVHGEYAP